jgi:ferredoxin
MLRISVDQSRCAGHARCFATAPEIFEIDDDGYTALNGVVEVDGPAEQDARFGAAACPEKIITILEEG